MIVDFSTASVQVQAHWEPIADATYNLHRPTQEQVDRLKAMFGFYCESYPNYRTVPKELMQLP